MAEKHPSEGMAALQQKVQDALNLAQETVLQEMEQFQAQQNQAASGGLDGTQLLGMVKQFNDTCNQVGLLNLLVESAGQYVPRCMLLIRKGAAVHAWAGSGFSAEFTAKQLKRVRWTIDQYPEISKVIQSGEPLTVSFSDLSEISDLISAFDGFVPLKSCFYPIQVKNKIAAILYCDTGSESRLENQDLVEVLARIAGAELTLVTTKIKKSTPSPSGAEPAETAEPAPKPAPKPAVKPAPAPAAPVVQFKPPEPALAPDFDMPSFSDSDDDLPAVSDFSDENSFESDRADVGFGNSFDSGKSLPSIETQAMEPQARETQPTPAITSLSDTEEDPSIKKARRVARVLVSDLKLYNESAVEVGVKNGDLYSRLQDDIDRSYKHYQERVSTLLGNNKTNYFKEELVRQLVGGDASKLGNLPF